MAERMRPRLKEAFLIDPDIATTLIGWSALVGELIEATALVVRRFVLDLAVIGMLQSL